MGPGQAACPARWGTPAGSPPGGPGPAGAGVRARAWARAVGPCLCLVDCLGQEGVEAPLGFSGHQGPTFGRCWKADLSIALLSGAPLGHCTEWEAPEPAGTLGAAWGRPCPSEAPKGREGSFLGRRNLVGPGHRALGRLRPSVLECGFGCHRARVSGSKEGQCPFPCASWV